MSENYSTTPDIVSYGIGRQLGDQLLSDPFERINAQAVANGVLDSLKSENVSCMMILSIVLWLIL